MAFRLPSVIRAFVIDSSFWFRASSLLFAGHPAPAAALGRVGAGVGDGVVVLDGRAADADGADDGALGVLDRDAAGEGDQAAVGHLDLVERLARLRELADLASR